MLHYITGTAKLPATASCPTRVSGRVMTRGNVLSADDGALFLGFTCLSTASSLTDVIVHSRDYFRWVILHSWLLTLPSSLHHASPCMWPIWRVAVRMQSHSERCANKEVLPCQLQTVCQFDPPNNRFFITPDQSLSGPILLHNCALCCVHCHPYVVISDGEQSSPTQFHADQRSGVSEKTKRTYRFAKDTFLLDKDSETTHSW